MRRAARRRLINLSAIVLAGLVLRLTLLHLVHNPGLHDPLHYYNLGRRLVQGHGFTIDYVWHYGRMPVDLVHATDHWMPLPGVAVALGMTLGGVNIHAALLLFLLTGALLSLLSFWACRLLDLPEACALIAAAFTALNPELVLNSLRTDTTILNAAWVCCGVLVFCRTLDLQKRSLFACSGILFGLAYLTRNDSILFLPMLLVFGLAASRLRPNRAVCAGTLLTIVAAMLTISPWLLRNWQEFGMLGSPISSRMPFMINPIDLYAYKIDITLESMLARQTIGELLGKRLFELAASVKQMAVALDLPALILTPLGIIWLVKQGDRPRLLMASPALIWVLGIVLVYPLLMPVHNQGGSFKKAFITIVPLLTPLAALALVKLSPRREWLWMLAALSIVWLGGRSVQLVQHQTALADKYHASIAVLVAALEELPDQTGDGEMRLMAQEPYVFSSVGIPAIVPPLASREDVLELATIYEIDYLMMPAARPVLDPLYLGAETDPRFPLALHLTDAGEKPWQLVRFARSP